MRCLSRIFFLLLLISAPACKTAKWNNFNKQKYTRLKHVGHFETTEAEEEFTLEWTAETSLDNKTSEVPLDIIDDAVYFSSPLQDDLKKHQKLQSCVIHSKARSAEVHSDRFRQSSKFRTQVATKFPWVPVIMISIFSAFILLIVLYFTKDARSSQKLKRKERKEELRKVRGWVVFGLIMGILAGLFLAGAGVVIGALGAEIIGIFGIIAGNSLILYMIWLWGQAKGADSTRWKVFWILSLIVGIGATIIESIIAGAF